MSDTAVLKRPFPEGRALEKKVDFEPRAMPAPPLEIAAGRSRRPLKKKLLIGGAALLFVAAAAGYGDYYWKTGQFLVSTDDAYVQAHSVLISPKVSSYLSEAPIDDNQIVRAGFAALWCGLPRSATQFGLLRRGD